MNGRAGPKAGPPLRPEDSTPDKPEDNWRDELVRLIGLSYEAAFDLADQAEADFSIIGEPLDRALRVLRGLRP